MKQRRRLISILIALSSLGAVAGTAPENAAGLSARIAARNRFLPLRPGAVRPEGWVLEEARRSAAGLGGLPEELTNNVWRTVPPVQGKGAFLWWPYEQDAYFADGATRLGHVLDDPRLKAGVRRIYDAVADRQTPDGYYFVDNPTFRELWREGDPGTDLFRWKKTGVEGMEWTMAVFSRGILAEYLATGDDRYLEILARQYRHYWNKGRDADKAGGPLTGRELYFNRGMVLLETMVEYLRLRDDRRTYDRAVQIFKNNEDGMVRNYLRGEYTSVCHGVTYLELTKLYATGYLLTGRREYLETAERAFDYLLRHHLQPHGVNSSEEFILGVRAFLGTETCDVVDFSWSALWLLRASGDGRFADRIEEAFYNAGQNIVTPDYREHVYFQAPDHLPGMPTGKLAEKFTFKPCHEPKCCVRNLTRLLPNFILHACMRADDGLALLFYIPCRVATSAGGVPVAFEVKTDYPFGETVEIAFTQEKSANIPFLLRIPEWCADGFSVTRNGKPVIALRGTDGFVRLPGPWQKGDRLRLRLPMQARLVEGREQILVGEGDRPLHPFGHGKAIQAKGFVPGAPYACVRRGPLLFALPVKSVEEARVALAVGRPEITVRTRPLPAGWMWAESPPPVTIELNAQPIEWNPDPAAPRLPGKIFPENPSAFHRVQLVPYGCARYYRLSMFPEAR